MVIRCDDRAEFTKTTNAVAVGDAGSPWNHVSSDEVAMTVTLYRTVYDKATG